MEGESNLGSGANSQDIDFEKQELRNQNLQLNGALASSSFMDQDEQNLIQYQLETDKILERLEHFLKGDQIKFNDGGSYYTDPTKNILAIKKVDKKTEITYYIQEIKQVKKGTEVIAEVIVKIEGGDGEDINVLQEDSETILNRLKKVKLISEGYKYIEILDEDKKPLNEYGVSELMRIASMYVTKEVFLSYYSEERINEIMSDLGNALNDFLYCNYEKMGMDTKFKESKYTMICLNLLHVIESCYRRALDGAEQENLRTRAIVTQNQGGFGGGGGQQSSMVHKQKFNLFKKDTW